MGILRFSLVLTATYAYQFAEGDFTLRPLPATPPFKFVAFTAQHDPRENDIKIHGTASIHHRKWKKDAVSGKHHPKLFCQGLWESEADVATSRCAKVTPSYTLEPDVAILVAAYKIQAAPSILSCPFVQGLKDGPPSHVLLSQNQNCTRQHIKVPISKSPLEPKVNVAVCVSPRMTWDHHFEILKWIPVMRKLGAGLFSIYQMEHAPPSLLPITNELFDSPDIEVIPWKFQELPEKTYLHGQLVAIQDCTYRNMLRANWILVADPDEYILPFAVNHTWTDMLNRFHRNDPYVITHQAYCPPDEAAAAKSYPASGLLPPLCYKPQDMLWNNKGFTNPKKVAINYQHFPLRLVHESLLEKTVKGRGKLWQDRWVTTDTGAMFHLRRMPYGYGTPWRKNPSTPRFHAADLTVPPAWMQARPWIAAEWQRLGAISEEFREKEQAEGW